jgi:hypothetical protein
MAPMPKTVIQDSDEDSDSWDPMPVPQQKPAEDDLRQPAAKRRKTDTPQKPSLATKAVRRTTTAPTSSSTRLSDLIPGVNPASQNDLYPGDIAWGMPPSLQEAFGQHQPRMFDDPSSTVPEDTMEQIRLIDEALQSDSEFPRTLAQMSDESNFTIPWSAIVNSDMVRN